MTRCYTYVEGKARKIIFGEGWEEKLVWKTKHVKVDCDVSGLKAWKERLGII